MPDARRVTLADVAQVAGVSSATVSRALKDDPRIGSRTTELVRRAAEQLNYVPNQAARSLVLNATYTLGLLVPELTDPLHGQVVAGFEQAAAARGYSVIIAEALSDPTRERRALQLFAGHPADGIALQGSILDQRQVLALVRPTRVAFINSEHLSLAGYDSGLPYGCVRTDDIRGIAALIQHLVVDAGYRRIGYVNGPLIASNSIRRDAAVRRIELLAGGGLDVDPRLRQYSTGSQDWRTGAAQLATRVAQDRDRPEALLCYDDKLALATIDALRTVGLSVPTDIAVVGFDDIPFAALANPRLTTVRQPSAEMGQLAVEMLLDAFVTDSMPRSVTLPVEVVVRESSLLSESSSLLTRRLDGS
jgi:DNA-binding LacI/PurR family transcriptional regulator